MPRLIATLLLFTLVNLARADCNTYSRTLANLIEPAKLATLGPRGANPRIQKAVAILETARRDGCAVAIVASNAVFFAGYTNALLAQMTRDALSRNHDIAAKLGVLRKAGLKDMRRGQSPTIKLGPYQGDELSVDHVVPFAVAPELGNVIANLELMPLRMNESKGDKTGERQRDYAKKFYAVGLLSLKRLKEIEVRSIRTKTASSLRPE